VLSGHFIVDIIIVIFLIFKVSLSLLFARLCTSVFCVCVLCQNLVIVQFSIKMTIELKTLCEI